MKQISKREKIKFIIDSSSAIAIISLICYILGTTYLATQKPFSLWWIFIILTILQAILSILYVYIIKKKVNLYTNKTTDFDYNILLIIVILNLITINFFLLIYGLFAFRKLFHRRKERDFF